MSKKYVPSGYQIINIDVSDKTSGTPFTPETEDEKLLYDLLSVHNSEIIKPILLTIIGTIDNITTGIGVISGINITLISGTLGNLVSERIDAVNDELTWYENEE